MDNQDNRPPAVPDETTERHNKPKRYNEIVSTIAIVVLAPLVALLLTQFVFQSYQVEGESMEQTLHDGDRLIVTKVSRSWARLLHKNYVPHRYDIIIFNHGGDFGDGTVEQKQLVKRVIGLPGDRIVVKDGVATVYNKDNPNGFLVDKDGPESATITVTNAPTEGGTIDETIKDGEIYVMGDNRENSFDSRMFGTVSDKDIVGHLAVRIYPFQDFKKF